MSREPTIHLHCDSCNESQHLNSVQAAQLWHEVTAKPVLVDGKRDLDLCPACAEEFVVWWRAPDMDDARQE